MNIELEAEAHWGLKHARTLAVGAALVLFLFHRLGLDPAEDLLAWLLIVLPAVEFSVFAGLAALVADGDGSGDRWTRLAAAFRWFGFVLLANWGLALFIAASLESYVKLGAPPVYVPPV